MIACALDSKFAGWLNNKKTYLKEKRPQVRHSAFQDRNREKKES